ncbi:MAG: EamA family transporter [Microbacteriaceae bacterium]|nr:MAG: EamA family transporter [Microbacteriaceae bacterium]
MEVNWRAALVTAIAPMAWGATYFVTQHTLPADSPLWGSALRAFPAGLVLLAIARSHPQGAREWGRTALLGVLNVGGFFLLIYIAAQLLPTSVASSIMAASPLVLAAFAWALLGQRPALRVIAGAVIGILGVLLLVGGGLGEIDGWGVAASVAGLVASSLGYVLTRRWGGTATPITASAWQLLFGGGLLLVAALLVEGAPPVLDATGWAGLAFVTLVGTALANVAWFSGLQRLSAGVVGVIGLLNPVTGVLLGVLAGGETLALAQGLGIALVLVGIAAGQLPARR